MLYKEGSGKYRQLEKLEINRVIEASNFESILRNWHALYADHDSLQVAQMTLDCISNYIRKDYKLD
jgi:hypothetical protein